MSPFEFLLSTRGGRLFGGLACPESGFAARIGVRRINRRARAGSHPFRRHGETGQSISGNSTLLGTPIFAAGKRTEASRRDLCRMAN